MSETKLPLSPLDIDSPIVKPVEVESRDRFIDLIQGLDAIIWEMDATTGKFTFVSRRAEDLLGYPIRQWLEEPDFWQNRLLHPEDRDWCITLSTTATQASQDYELEYRALATDGRIIWLKDRVRVVADENGRAARRRGVLVDITQEKAAVEQKQQLSQEQATRLKWEAVQDALRKNEERYCSLLKATTQIVWNTNAEGKIVSPQPGWSAFTGQTFEEYQDWGWLNCVHPDDRDNTAQAWLNAVENKTHYEVEYRLRRHDGEYRYMSVRGVSVLAADGSIREWVGIHTDITDPKQAKEALRQEQEFTKVLVENFSEAVVACNANGKLTLFNRVAREWHGLDPLTVPPEQWTSLYDLYEEDGVTPLATENIPLVRAFQGESVRNAEMAIVAKGQPPRYILANGDPLFDDKGRKIGAVALMHDITERKRVQEALAKALGEAETARAELQRVFLQAPAAIQTSRGPNHVIETSNPLYGQLVNNREIKGKTAREAFPDLEGQGFFELLDRVYATGKAYVGKEMRAVFDRNGDGELEESFWNFVYQPLFDSENQVYGLMTHAVEVTAQVRARQEVEKKAEALTQLTQALERSNQELEQFAYIASHDLKAPLRAIANLSEWLEEDLGDTLNEDSRQHLNLMRGRVHRMESLIDGILQYSRAGRLCHQTQTVDVDALLADVVELLDPSPEVAIVIQPGMPTFHTEKIPLEQIFMNLISNAIKYSYRPDVRIEIGSQEVGSYYQFSVADNGQGIAPEYHQKIWIIFQRLEARDKVEGTGIGLSVVKKIIESRGGRVWVESEVGAGATFYFTWPKST
ncbi:MAG: PAS domain S-box protein [Kastovskya adunca ATA6-11-RM4]|jgi:PAS domain S-box-containing protein|nr:PAS domain S-box protein [Kastovskya adunca ATA6-11-RM4]